MTVSPISRSRSVIAVALIALGLGGCSAERFGAVRNPFTPDSKPAYAQTVPAQAMPVQTAPARHVAAGPAVMAPGPAAVAVHAPQPGPGQRVTDAPVGAGVNVQPGGNEDFIVNVGRRVFFTEGSAQLTNIARTTLDNQAAWLKQHPAWQAKIQGFADDPGTDASNLALGKQRAEAVMNYLVSKGVAAGRLRAKTYGRAGERIVRNCTDASCKAQNRRVITNLEAARAR